MVKKKKKKKKKKTIPEKKLDKLEIHTFIAYECRSCEQKFYLENDSFNSIDSWDSGDINCPICEDNDLKCLSIKDAVFPPMAKRIYKSYSSIPKKKPKKK